MIQATRNLGNQGIRVSLIVHDFIKQSGKKLRTLQKLNDNKDLNTFQKPHITFSHSHQHSTVYALAAVYIFKNIEDTKIRGN